MGWFTDDGKGGRRPMTAAEEEAEATRRGKEMGLSITQIEQAKSSRRNERDGN